MSFPAWLHALAWASILLCLSCTAWVTIDVLRRPPKMAVMRAVWPLTMLFGGPLWLAFYLRHAQAENAAMPVAVAVGTSHCGAGCALGDLIVEWLAFAVPGLAVAFGWHGLFAEKSFAVWIPDFIAAYLIGIVFQYFSIAPMRDLGFRNGIVAAIKADTASITAWQIGMYAMMALIQFGWLERDYGRIAPVASPEFWMAMQLAMIAGFVTAYPVNWWLIRAGLKEKM